MRNFLGSVFAATAVAISAPVVQATPVDVDVMFVIDQSGSMNNEFSTLSTNIATFANGLSGNSGVSSLGLGLATYEEARNGVGNAGCSTDPNEPCLRLWNPISTSSDLSGLQSSLDTASANTFGGREDALTAIDSVLPGGVLFSSSGWRNDTVKSVVLITDEDADDAGFYSNAFGTGYAALGAKLDDVKYLNNIITDNFTPYEDIAKPTGALFDIDDFTGSNADPEAFLTQFANAKLEEITTGGETTGGSGPNVVPLPAAGWMLLGGLGGLFALRRRMAS